MPGQNHGIGLANLDDLNRKRTSQYFPSVVTCPWSVRVPPSRGAVAAQPLGPKLGQGRRMPQPVPRSTQPPKGYSPEGQLPRYNLADSLSSNPVHLANCTQGALILALPAIASPEDQGISLCTRWCMGAPCQNAGEAASLGKFNGDD